MSQVRIGVVSYEGSRFLENQGEFGLAMQLRHALERLNVSAEVRIVTEDWGHRYGVHVTPGTVQDSLHEQLKLQWKWSRFLDQPRSLQRVTRNGLRLIRRTTQCLRPPAKTMITRLLNIEASHRDLLAWGSSGEAQWLIILEDDAMSTDVEDLARGLLSIIRSDAPPNFVNLSESFTSNELGVNHLLSEVTSSRWEGPRARVLLESRLPVTNTVCAVLYRAAFARRLLMAYERLPIEPVLPIDWKLNAVLMLMHKQGAVAPNSCWTIKPAPILQMSMR